MATPSAHAPGAPEPGLVALINAKAGRADWAVEGEQERGKDLKGHAGTADGEAGAPEACIEEKQAV